MSERRGREGRPLAPEWKTPGVLLVRVAGGRPRTLGSPMLASEDGPRPPLVDQTRRLEAKSISVAC